MSPWGCTFCGSGDRWGPATNGRQWPPQANGNRRARHRPTRCRLPSRGGPLASHYEAAGWRMEEPATNRRGRAPLSNLRPTSVSKQIILRPTRGPPPFLFLSFSLSLPPFLFFLPAFLIFLSRTNTDGTSFLLCLRIDSNSFHRRMSVIIRCISQQRR